MGDIRKVHCLFEQSGTFKREFERLGIQAEDYDILDDFGETDHVMDLFSEIEKAVENEPSVFDQFDRGDLLFAFFPCVRFEDQVMMLFRGDSWSQKTWDDEKKLEYSLKLQNEQTHLYAIITKLALVCLRRDLRLIIENPYSAQNYLTRQWPLKPSIIDMDRRQNGDHYKKPTQYWFINFEPKNNLLFEPIDHVDQRIIEKETGCQDFNRKVQRSLISPQYASRFIRSHILDGGD